MNKIDVRRKIVFRYFFLGEELNMKKILLALLLAAVMGAGAGAAEIDDTIDGVWGVKFGTSVAEANRIMTEQNAAALLCEYSYVPNYHEAFYKVNFFGREGHLLLRFSKRGLFLARFALFARSNCRLPRLREPTSPKTSIRIRKRRNISLSAAILRSSTPC